MDQFVAWVGSLTVGQTVIAVSIVLALLLVALVSLTSLLIPLRIAALLWIGGAAVAIGLVLFLPVDTSDLVANPDPAGDYDAAVAMFAEKILPSPQPLNPLCEPQLLTHGAATDTVVVLIHGVSSCPRAFVDFAPLLHERGHNVVTVRMPENGYADRSTDALRDLTAEKLAAAADDAVDVAAGLGETVVVLGISAGGTMAAWAGQNRAEVDRTVLVAPFFGLGSFGVRLNMAIMRATLMLPPISIWKDPIQRTAFQGMPHAYQRQSTRGTGEIMRLGLGTYRQAREAPAGTNAVAVIVNDADTAVDNEVTRAFLQAWIDQGVPMVGYEFDAGHGLGHELIDPLEPGADPALTYPIIVEMIEGGAPEGSVGTVAAITAD